MQPRPEHIAEALDKFAVSGGMYSRALGNAAQRAGGRIGQPALNAVAAQPRARLAPGFAERARTPGVIAPTQSQQGLQHMMEGVPWAGAEHGGDPMAKQQYTQALQQTGRTYQGGPGLEKQMLEQFGAPWGHPGYAPFAATQAAAGAHEPTLSMSSMQGTVAGKRRKMGSAYADGFDAALARYGVKDAGLKEKLLPFALAAGIGGGAVGAKHMGLGRHHMPVQQAVQTELPNFQGALGHELSRLDAAANAR